MLFNHPTKSPQKLSIHPTNATATTSATGPQHETILCVYCSSDRRGRQLRCKLVSSEEFSDLLLFAKYAGAAYCAPNQKIGDPVFCKGEICPGRNATILATFAGRITDIQGFLAEDPENKILTVSIRGSHTIQNFITDIIFRAEAVDREFCAGCRVHAGFLYAYKEIVARLPPILFSYRHTSPELWLGSGPPNKNGYLPGDVLECLGSANVKCNAGRRKNAASCNNSWGTSVIAHLHYLVPISYCGSWKSMLDMSLQNGTDDLNSTDPELAERLDMFAKLDLEYAEALEEDGSVPEDDTMQVLQTKPVPTGTPEFEAKLAALLQQFADGVPQNLRLPEDVFTNPPPVDVTAIPASCGLLSATELEITEQHDATALADAIARRRYTAVEVATAFCKRAIIAHQLTACLAEWFMNDAVAQARRLDEHLERHGTTVGPLHGVPVSIKGHILMAGTFYHGGSLSSLQKSETDSQLVAILRGLGAVFFCKTAQPQTLMHLESDSARGRVLNPYNVHLSAGGSSGGEAALVAMKGSVLGVGTDIGGSVRGPAAFCGIYGFKATSYLLPMRGFTPSPFAAELNVLCSLGPMCRSLRDMDLFMRVVLATKPHLQDPNLVPIPWSALSQTTGSSSPSHPSDAPSSGRGGA
ncbi:hypothetical protein MAPG_07222 [Magnaporthiopsis poae ATCC 64411]|uniref:amidase n=1 Tax=Magnaporthiopsis poae (strain ATCC 64411 / 73-15) TaxID=644358 RepID=A0A0C4E434_MAGP6|nr:hypothetical protein MAPG_07222 [Magnaporthiopsis poae ATCC 64411]